MSGALEILFAFCVGVLLGFAFFWGLWLTLAGLARTQHPVRRVVASFVLRFGVVLTGFYLVAYFGGLEHVVAGVIGFTISRFVLVRLKNARLLETIHQEPDA